MFRFPLNPLVTQGLNASRAYFNLALLHLARNDHQQFFEVLEKALEKGFQVQNVMKDPKCEAMMTDPHMKRLMEKYSGN